MVVIVLDCAPEGLRGELTRWLLEPKPCVFVGKVNALVREKLWQKIGESDLKGALMIYSDQTEQGFTVKMQGEPLRTVVDLDGIQLIKIQ